MKREFLTGLGIEGLNDEMIQKIMDEHGKTVNTNKKSYEQSLQAAEDKLNSRANITSDDFQKLNKELAETKLGLKEAMDKLKPYQDINIDDLNNQLSQANDQLQQLTSQHKETVDSLQADALLRESLASIQFSSDYAKKGVYDDVKARIEYEPGPDGAIGCLKGFDDIIKELREKQPSAFATGIDNKAEGIKHKNEDDEADDFVKGFNS